jgi:two-component system, chemotaxis family, protein-glutamate methylesterase/glutaminase
MMAKRIVVMGTSLGGLNALGVVLAGIPRDFPLPIAIVQHRSKESDSGLAELLQRQSSLAVEDANDKMPIEVGHVYLAPPDYHLLVGAEEFSLSTEAPVAYARPSIDVLFDSAANSFGSGVIAVVLTGASEDGARGAAVVKQKGGRIIVQDPKEAESPVMPLAVVSRKLADAVVPLSAIPLELQRAAHH